MFQKLCGNDALKNVVLATTFWNQVDEQVGARREKELIDEQMYWGKMVAMGSKVMRLGLTRDSAMSVLRAVASNSKVILETQLECDQEAGGISARILTDLGSAQEHGNTGHEWEQWHQDRTRRQEADKQKWDEELNKMKEKLQRQTEALKEAKARTEKERERAKHNERKRVQLYKSHKCRCSLSGPARCGTCKRNVGKTFYRKSPNLSFDLA